MIGVCKTDGKGHWSHHAREVEITKLVVRTGEGRDLLSARYGELCAYFNPEDWNPNEHGLIYTDKLWLEQFQKLLFRQYGFSVAAIHDITYSEQGMQGRDYVSMDVGSDFMQDCDKLTRFLADRPLAIEIQVEDY